MKKLVSEMRDLLEKAYTTFKGNYGELKLREIEEIKDIISEFIENVSWIERDRNMEAKELIK